MHPNRAFDWTDRAELLAFIADTSFCTIFVGGHVVHVPVTVHGSERLRFHIARGNRAAAAIDDAPALISCMGLDAYISPDWYGTRHQVPTWNYVAVEAEGRLRRLDDAGLADQIDALGAAHEARLAPKPPWTRARMAPGRYQAMAKAIVGYELVIEALRGTRKLGQHKKPGEREGAYAGLAAAGRADMAALMRAEPAT